MQTARTLGLGLQLAAKRSAVPAGRNVFSQQSALSLRGATRTVTIKSVPASAAQDVLNAQRLNRPSSPHFTIYQPQITWLASIAHRGTGGALSGLLYAFSIAYLAAPAFGVPFDSATIVEFVHSLPEWTKLTGKTLLAAPFVFHSFNGIRHLSWDAVKLTSVKAVTRSGYAVLAATAVSTIYLVLQ
ncbi:cytochrome b subunit of succinate dehydrogenase, Sdh3p [Tulasnella sp. 418]|nr:cytochrome b subunit of succinate dehydrogenase, Sdh3p [Tulasnella sp. 418]